MERIKTAIDKARQARAPSFLDAETQTPNIRVRAAASPPGLALSAGRSETLDLAHLEAHRIVALDPGHPARWSFDLLRTQVLQRMAEKGWKTLAVTSPTVSSGKTVVAINLALSIAHHPERSAVLVDFDLRRPHVANYLGLKHGTFLDEVLEGSRELKDAVLGVGLPNFCVLSTRRPLVRAAEILSSARCAQLIAQLRGDSAITILDMPPVTAVDDVIAVLPRIDCVLLVIGNGMSTKREIQEAQRHLAPFNLIGTVLNKAVAPVRHAGYYQTA